MVERALLGSEGDEARGEFLRDRRIAAARSVLAGRVNGARRLRTRAAGEGQGPNNVGEICTSYRRLRPNNDRPRLRCKPPRPLAPVFFSRESLTASSGQAALVVALP